jgi:3,4-dihydroxy 2-butanone 4-phosphate synthase
MADVIGLSSGCYRAATVRPGHVFPLCAAHGGVLTRRGHTEGAVDLAKMAGLRPAAALCELMNVDGSMMRGLAIESFAARHKMPILSIAEIVAWRCR